MQYVFRFNIQPGKSSAFVDWVRDNADRLREHAGEGWEYAGIYFSVQGFGDYDAEYRSNVEDYAGLGAERDDATNALIAEMFGEFVDFTQRPTASLMKSADDVTTVPGT